MTTFLLIVAACVAGLLLGAALLHLTTRSAPGARLVLCRAPFLDLVVAYFTVGPWILGPALAVSGGFERGGERLPWWAGLLAGVAAQVVALIVWIRAHEFVHRRHTRGPRIVTTLNRSVGRVRNHAAVWWTALAVPVFWIVRAAELIVYPPLVWLVRFPSYRQGEWVNVSRQKFEGLVGHDLVWCLYCDWMTGVWSLGSEMLRNVESFWCPIRFLDAKKCENCAIDFPDIENGWVRAEDGMAGVAATLSEKYPPGARPNAWFGHASRAADLTVEGRHIRP